MNEWTVDKRSYNQGNKIVTSANPVWDAENASHVPVNDTHTPCGYWFQGGTQAVKQLAAVYAFSSGGSIYWLPPDMSTFVWVGATGGYVSGAAFDNNNRLYVCTSVYGGSDDLYYYDNPSWREYHASIYFRPLGVTLRPYRYLAQMYDGKILVGENGSIYDSNVWLLDNRVLSLFSTGIYPGVFTEIHKNGIGAFILALDGNRIIYSRSVYNASNPFTVIPFPTGIVDVDCMCCTPAGDIYIHNSVAAYQIYKLDHVTGIWSQQLSDYYGSATRLFSIADNVYLFTDGYTYTQYNETGKFVINFNLPQIWGIAPQYL